MDFSKFGVPSLVLTELAKMFPGRGENFTPEDVQQAQRNVWTKAGEANTLRGLSLAAQMSSSVSFRAEDLPALRRVYG